MTSPRFIFPVRDLENGPKLVRTRLGADWLSQILAGTEVRPHGEEIGEISLSLTMVGRDVLVRGKLDVMIETPCARTLDPAVYRLKPEVFLLLGHGPAKAHPEKPNADGSPRRIRGHKTPGTKPKTGWEDDPELSLEDAARDTFSGDSVILDDFLREFILLEVPMVPLREDLRSGGFEASPSPPGGSPGAGVAAQDVEKTIDPRLSPLAELKARLEKNDKKE